MFVFPDPFFIVVFSFLFRRFLSEREREEDDEGWFKIYRREKADLKGSE